MTRLVQTLIATAASVTLVAALAVAEGGNGGGVDDRYVAVNWGRRTEATTVAIKGDRAQVARLVVSEAQRQGVDPKLALAVTKVESGFRCRAIGPRTRHGRAQGPLQILESSARELGFATTDLNSCGNGLAAGMAHLARCRALAGEDKAATARCHVQGWKRDPRVPVNGYAQRYTLMVMREYARL